MSKYIDGFVLPIPKNGLEKYKGVAEQVALIWKEYGALEYYEYVGEDLELAGTRTFPDALAAGDEEAIIFGWVVFESKEARILANKKVAADPRMVALIAPIVDPSKVIFNASRMVFGGFESLV